MLNNINDVKFYCDFLLNKNQSGGMSGREFNSAINVAQQSYLRTKLGLPETFTIQSREAPQQFQATIENATSLKPFTVSAILNKSGNGFNLPSNFAAWGNNDYLYVYQDENSQSQAETQPIEFVNLSERAVRLNNYITKPTLEYGIATYIDNQLVVDPSGIDKIKLIYVRYPSTPIWNFTVNTNDQEVYNPTGSVQLEFPNMDWESIAALAVKYCSIFLREEQLFAITDKRIKEGA